MIKKNILRVIFSILILGTMQQAEAQDFRGELIINCFNTYERTIQGQSIKNSKYVNNTMSGLRFKRYLNDIILFRSGYFYRSYHTTDNYTKIAKADRPTDKVITQELRIGAEIRIGDKENFVQPYIGSDVYFSSTKYDFAAKTTGQTQKDRVTEWGWSPILGLHVNLSDTYVFSIDAAYNLGAAKGTSEVNTGQDNSTRTFTETRKTWIPICGLGMGVRF
jgi:hypothetical protein